MQCSARGWSGLDHEDWRYRDLRQQTGRWYWLVSFSGIHMFPTVQVFLGCLALYPALVTASPVLAPLDAIAAAVTMLGIVWETVADRQLYDYTQTRKEPGETFTEGLWSLSRHPNYFGEMTFWWGLYLFGLAANPDWWWTIVGPLAITVMFVLVSLPMIDNRMLASRPDYGRRIDQVPAVIPTFRRRERAQSPDDAGSENRDSLQ